jgi:cobalt-zinc-cadmium efflux system membrane fusion protein
MKKIFYRPLKTWFVLWSIAITLATGSALSFAIDNEMKEITPEKGPNGGRLLTQKDLTIELSIFETGIPPEFRVWVTSNVEPVAPELVPLTIKLTRLGDVVDHINFTPQADFLRGDMEIYEPHSFVVTIDASYEGKEYQWKYDNFEGRTLIETKVAEAMDIQTAKAGQATLSETIEVFGRIVAAQDAQRNISARFDGQIKSMPVKLVQAVKSVDLLATIESNESLNEYSIISPIDGVVVEKSANTGEQTDGRILLSITNLQALNAELSVFPSDRSRVKPTAIANINVDGIKEELTSKVTSIDSHLQSNQSTIVRVALDNTAGALFPGQFVTGEIEVARYTVPLAVKREGLQAFRDFTVVYAKVGEQYEVRMLELGRQAGEWIEVLGGLDAGTEYVTKNSFIIKADIEKSGASHDH